MAKVGDLRGNVEKLKSQLRPLRFPLEELDDAGLETGRPTALLPILHYVFLGFSRHFACFVEDRGYELQSKSDLRFLELVYKCLRTELDYRPHITTTQFFAQGFAERKVIFLQDVVRIARNTHNDLCAKAPKTSVTKVCEPAKISEVSQPSRSTMADTIRMMQTKSVYQESSPSWDGMMPNKPPVPAPFQRDTMPLVNGSPAEPITSEPNGSFSPAAKRDFPSGELFSFGVTSKSACSDDLEHAVGASSQKHNESLRAIVEEAMQSQFESGFQRLETVIAKSMQEVTGRLTVLEGELKILSGRISDSMTSTVTHSAPNRFGSSNAMFPETMTAKPGENAKSYFTPTARLTTSTATGTPFSVYNDASRPSIVPAEPVAADSRMYRVDASRPSIVPAEPGAADSRVSGMDDSRPSIVPAEPGAADSRMYRVDASRPSIVPAEPGAADSRVSGMDDSRPSIVPAEPSAADSRVSGMDAWTTGDSRAFVTNRPASVAVPSAQETELLISQLTAKFRDTQELLDKARGQDVT